MSFPTGLDIARGVPTGASAVFKFGRNSAIGTTFTPICSSGVYRTPQVAGIIPLRIRAGGDAQDAAGGTGAREVTLQGLDATGAFVSETIVTAGAAASASTTTEFLRLFRLYVSASGTYATQAAGSHADTITIEDTGGNEWASIDATGFPRGQSQIGAYTIPLGYTGYISDVELSTEGTKLVNLNFYARSGILQTAPPYDGMRLKREFVGLEGSASTAFPVPQGPYDELTDIGFMGAVAAQTADVSISFTVILMRAR